ncbi:putative hmg box protein [Phaeomoniella chlamydospora]|uniref:Putative hmg box protein n=1 Tax=Phaeomoniella chlamydospora TaxID=158046 RepID=A0A0G2ES41_PHACM|nr:putative hmg box protein [Phaeomoniella chlamydospora]
MSSDPKKHYSEDEQLPSVKKRKYRKHPKPDLNAPKKPSPSAYHLFALTEGEKLRKQGFGFEDIARGTGARWRALSPSTVNDLEAKTTQAKNQYRKDMAAYKKGPDYKAYQDYLKRWMAKEEMKQKQQSDRERKVSSASIQLPAQPTSNSSTSTASPTSSTNEEMPMLDWTTSNNSQASDVGQFMTIPDDWFTVPELSTAEHLQWKWSADFGVTLAPDPLFPMQSMEPSNQDSYATTVGMGTSSTISPAMLAAQSPYAF